MRSEATETSDDVSTLDDFLGEIDSLDPNPLLDDALIMRLTYDMATGLHKSDVLARRYGLASPDALRKYLKSHPRIVSEAQKLRALFHSDGSAEDRVRLKFLHATEELITPMAVLVSDPRTPMQTRIDGFKQIQRGAGLDGMTAAAKAAAGKEQGQPFQLTINFAHGREPLNITGEVIENAEIPTPSMQLEQIGRSTSGSAEDFEEEEDEEVGEDV